MCEAQTSESQQFLKFKGICLFKKDSEMALLRKVVLVWRKQENGTFQFNLVKFPEKESETNSSKSWVQALIGKGHNAATLPIMNELNYQSPLGIISLW